MGYTSFTKSVISTILNCYDIKSVLDLGAQNDHSLPDFAMPYTSEWYKEKDILYDCIDINEENKAVPINLAFDLNHGLNKGLYDFLKLGQYDLIVDAGTSEHVCREGKFSWEAIYQCWEYKFHLCKNDGIIISENPKTGNWPGHGFNYYTKEFYRQLNSNSDLQTILLDEHPAMHNTTDGWNVISVMQKKGKNFPSLDIFKKFSLKTS